MIVQQECSRDAAPGIPTCGRESAAAIASLASSSRSADRLTVASPFVKWAGGKRSVIRELVARLPSGFKDYHEPFAGGAALFFEIHKQLGVAYLSDNNLELMVTYQVVKKEPGLLAELLKQHAARHNIKYYYKVRRQHELGDPVRIAARFLYLNRTCYNGLYRVNQKGQFNVPIGRYKRPSIVDEKKLFACSAALRKTRVQFGDFTRIRPRAGDFVYFDPPYHPTGEVSFTRYTDSNFTEKDQVRLREFALELHRGGVLVMLSNSNTSLVRQLYGERPFRLEIIRAPRLVNCKPEGRASIDEALITNY